ncbi:MAG TPA: class I SAM-dependent methyltransferase, partial [Sphingomicrobium sp.]|nr:class I SAM-dependent methyltransferase [Sphingomicrobium sp.]
MGFLNLIALALSGDQTPMEKLAAKIRKRAGQVFRLGPTGIARTAYIKTLGRTVQSSADYGRGIARRARRRKAHGFAIEDRVERLKRRLQGRAEAGPPADSEQSLRMDFAADRGRFVQLLEAILDLAEAGCAVPRLVSVDWATNSVTAAAPKGRTYREAADPELAARIEDALLAIHRAGYVLDQVREDSILIADDGSVIVTGVGDALPLAGLSRDMSVYLRDIDREAFNHLFGTRLLTAGYLRRRDSAPVTLDRPDAAADCAYASIVIRDDVHWGNIWNTDVGSARWDFILKDHLPIPQGGTVLDLGANVGLNPLQMLRHGAASAVGIEYDENKVRNSLVLKAAFEWLDNRSYDFRCIHASFADLPSLGLGRFDVVTALCALYYLSEQEMRDLVAYIRTITNLLVLQCNTDRLIDRAHEETFRKA